MSGLVSKVLAGSLSAGVFLVWWPGHAPGDGPEWLLVRGVLMALAFEILLMAFLPLERVVAGAVSDRPLREVSRREGARALALALAGLAVPAALLPGVRSEPDKARAAAPKERVIVKREIVRREVVVKRVRQVVPVTTAGAPATVTTPAPAASRSATPSTTSSKASSSTKKGSTLVVKAPARAKAKTTTTSSASATPTATTPATTAPAATPQTAAAATPAAASPATTAATPSS